MYIKQLTFKVYLLKDISKDDVLVKIGESINKTLCKDEKYLKFHEKNTYKLYCYNALYPLEKDGIYKEGSIYSFIFRTVDEELLKYIKSNLVNEYTDSMKFLTVEEKVIPKKHIEKIYSLTPVILKTDNGYWKKNLSLDEFDKRLKANIIKKYNKYFNTKIEENFNIYDNVIFHNEKPVAFKYKGVTLLGDKITLFISSDEQSQKLAQFALGTGILELNSTGAGFVNFKWI